MAIYDIFEFDRSGEEQSVQEEVSQEPQVPSADLKPRDRFFSSLIARLFFLLLLIADILWFIYAAILFVISSILALIPFFHRLRSKMWLSIKRSLVCGLSLFVTLFSPAFGVMIACTYFLMYDKAGIEEVIPSSLQSQFKEFFKE